MSSFVTRSFFLGSRKAPPQEYRHLFKEVTDENLLDALLESSGYLGEFLSLEVTDNEFQALGEFTDKQMKILRLNDINELHRYKQMKDAVERDVTIYHIIASKNYLSEHLILSDFIYGSIILEEREEI